MCAHRQEQAEARARVYALASSALTTPLTKRGPIMRECLQAGAAQAKVHAPAAPAAAAPPATGPAEPSAMFDLADDGWENDSWERASPKAGE